MKDLVELIGKENGYSVLHIHNQIERINYNISELVKAGYKVDVKALILTAIEYSLNFKLQNEYKHILNYIQEK